MRSSGASGNRKMWPLEAKVLEAAVKNGPLRDLRSKSPPKSVLMASSSEFP
jgi:hypothetical protein